MRALLFWLKEVFSHKAFLISNIILLLSISIFTFAFTLFNSISKGTDNVITTLVTGDYLLTVPYHSSRETEKELKKNNISYDKMILEFALFSTKNKALPLQVRGVSKSYFTPKRKKMLGINDVNIEEGLYLFYKNSESGVLTFSSEKRGTLYKNVHSFNSGFKSLDEYIAFMCVDNIDEYKPQSDVTFSIIESENSKNRYKTLQILNKIASENDGKYEMKENLAKNFYSSLSASFSSFYLISMLFVLLASFYTISISLSFKKDNAHLIKMYRIFGVPYSRILVFSMLSIFFTILIFIVLGFSLGLLLTLIFPHFASFISYLFSLDLSYYFLSFPISIPFINLMKTYLFEIVLSVLISLFTFMLSSKKDKNIWG